MASHATVIPTDDTAATSAALRWPARRQITKCYVPEGRPSGGVGARDELTQIAPSPAMTISCRASILSRATANGVPAALRVLLEAD